MQFNLMKQNKKLKNISVYKISNEHFQRIAEELPNLELIFYGGSIAMDDVNRIVCFIKTAKNLKKIELLNCANDLRGEILGEIQIKDEWKICNHFVTTFVRSDNDRLIPKVLF